MATIFQTKEWEDFKLATGWQKSWRVFDVLVLEKKIPLLGSMLYSPMLSHDQTKLSAQKIFIDQIHKIGAEENAVFFRMESSDEKDTLDPTDSGYRKSFEEMQPEHTLLIDLSQSDDDILTQMKQKGRYNIKIAEKHEIKFEIGSIDDFYPLYETMARRSKITFRSREYFQKLIDIMAPKDYLAVYKATTPEGEVLACAVITYYKDTCTYLFGGSSDSEREKMAPYKLHWEIIKEAKRRGCRWYDMFGIAPTEDEKHPWAGVTRFKKQFGGKELAALGSWDLVLSPMKYNLFKIAEKIRR